MPPSRRSRASILTVAALLAAAPLCAADLARPDYVVATVEFRPEHAEQIGSVRAGMLCLPKGPLRLRDLARPEDGSLVRQLENTLRDGGMSVSPPVDRIFADQRLNARYRLRVTIEQIELRLCVPGLGIGERRPTAKGMVRVRWDTFDGETRSKVASAAFDEAIAADNADLRQTSGPLVRAIIATASRYADSRR